MSDWRVSFTRKAEKEFRKAEVSVQRRIRDALKRVVALDPSVDVRKLVSRKGELRLRVGDWRVIYTRDDERKLFLVLRVLARDKDTYS